MRREEFEWGVPARMQVPRQSTGAEGLVVARMAVKAAGAKGSRHLVTTVGQLGNEEEPFARDEAVFDFETLPIGRLLRNRIRLDDVSRMSREVHVRF